MKKPSNSDNANELRNKIIGLGDKSARKSYYPQLQARITELEIAKRRAEESENRFRILLNSTSDGIFIFYSESRNLYMANETACKLIGYSPNEIGMLALEDIHPYTDKDRVIKEFDLLKSDKLHLTRDIPVKKKDGTIIYCDINASNIEMDGMEFIILAYRDITEIRESELRKKEIEKKLNEAQKLESIGIMAGGVAHDFNNILSVIMGLTEILLQQNISNDDLTPKLKKILEASTRARDLIKQLMTISYHGNDERAPKNMITLVDESVAMMRATIPSSIEIDVKGCKCNDLVMADETQINQILINLFNNSAYAMPNKKGKIKILYANEFLDEESLKYYPLLKVGEYFKIEFCDSGSGIDKEIIDRVFDPFYTTKPKGEGTGLGLSIIHGIIKKHKGNITVESDPGRGTKFTIHLPVYKGEIMGTQSDSMEINKGQGRIMIVDDEETLAEVNGEMLKLLEYDVTVITESTKALETFKASPDNFDLILTDMTMPGMNGLDLAEEIIKIRPEIPIILCTGFSDQVTKESAKSIGISEFLNKPVTLKNLAAAVDHTLNK